MAMKTYKIIVRIVSLLIGIIVTVYLYSTDPAIKASFSGNITTEDYQILKDYAMEIVSGSDVELPEEVDKLNISLNINEKEKQVLDSSNEEEEFNKNEKDKNDNFEQTHLTD